MVKKFFIIMSLLLVPLSLAPSTVSAIDIVSNKVCNKAKNSTVCTDKNVGENNPLSGPNGVLTKVINLLTIVVGIVAIITIILGGLKYVTSGSNAEDVTKARERVIYSLVAILIAASAQLIVRYVIGRVG